MVVLNYPSPQCWRVYGITEESPTLCNTEKRVGAGIPLILVKKNNTKNRKENEDAKARKRCDD